MVTDGLQSILTLAGAYNLFQRLVGGHKARTRFLQEYVGPFPGARVLDIGCGTGTIVEYLPATTQYVGFDANPHYIAYARKKYPTRGSFLSQRVTDPLAGTHTEFDRVLAKSILHHLNDDEARRLFALAFERLKPGGVLVTFDGVFVEHQSSIARYIISKDRGRHVRSSEGYAALARTSFNRVQSYIRDDLLAIPYTHLIMKCVK
jgi:SAM-dependent methyltransferase